MDYLPWPRYIFLLPLGLLWAPCPCLVFLGFPETNLVPLSDLAIIK